MGIRNTWHGYWYMCGHQATQAKTQWSEIRGGSAMNTPMKTDTEHEKTHLRDRATRQAIFELLQARDMRPGDCINIILAQFEIERKGIDNAEFSTGVVQLLDKGLLNMQGNAFYLTDAGFEALRRPHA